MLGRWRRICACSICGKSQKQSKAVRTGNVLLCFAVVLQSICVELQCVVMSSKSSQENGLRFKHICSEIVGAYHSQVVT